MGVYTALQGVMHIVGEEHQQRQKEHQQRQKGNKTEAIIYVCLAILFQPLVKIALGRQVWNIVDVAVGVGLIASIFIKPKHI